MRSSLSIVFTVTAILMLSACPYSAQNYPDTVAQAHCGFLYQCCNATERVLLFGSNQVDHSNEAECVEEYGKAFRHLYGPYTEAAKQGRATWDEEKAQACIEDIEKASNECDANLYFEPVSDSDRCDLAEVAAGNVDDGDSCYNDFECASDGSGCLTDAERAGEPSNANVAACQAYIRSVNTVYEECDVESTIEENFCDSYEDLDADCTVYFDCLGNSYLCEDDGTISVDTSACSGCTTATESLVYQIEGECVALPTDGSPCLNGECANDHYCGYDSDAEEELCKAQKNDGESCDSSLDCKSNLCIENICSTLKPDGSDCEAWDECESFECSDDVCGDGQEVDYDICKGTDNSMAMGG